MGTCGLSSRTVAGLFVGGNDGSVSCFQGRETYGEALWAKIQEERHGTSVQISGAPTTGFFVAFFFEEGLNSQSLNGTLFGGDQTFFANVW